MLNQIPPQNSPAPSQWCVGEPPVRWDVSFGARLAEQIKRIFWRESADQPVQANKPLLTPMKKAA